MKNTVVLKDLWPNMEKYTNKVSSCEFFDSHWKEVVDFTKIKKGGINIDELLSALTIERRSDKTYGKF